ncbi:ABC-2 type transport system ATP-binding protein [Streptomyces sp. KhCrAH-43]|uniref:ABC transporter ATP-binding protein n=1 Tax=unclassified Streptomyces TaxID=2593676 RepID=UPI0003797B91|nr:MULTISPECIES: ATP-binding cassette domain-containing protein [unclassified Streptomyces]MYS36860.1 ATP-binding cassette domain-containing protein [Streptomyces sp. SID4920]MYX69331.1 ATP-binding cassette domain-containing protein [Streptomyces sp. SID8373]RAJ62181.1 ABC-2 type transport system ATP-binding protein [Streptomyces sp. KhCrAH-43]
MTSIDVHELTKDYGGTRAVDHLTFQVRPGRVTGFLGPNGAGKSTTMRLLLGLDRPTGGTATIGGQPYAALPEPLRHVGALLDPQAAHAARTARDHLLAFAVSNGLGATRVEKVLEEAGIGHVSGRRIRTFSLGMRQRLGIATALLGDPAVVMLDEPSNGLDPEGIVWIRELMRRLAREGRTVLVSSHLMNETSSFADHLIVLGQGRLLADLPMRTFLESRSRPRARVRTTEPARLAELLAREGYRAAPGEDGRWTVEDVRAEDIGAMAAKEGIPIVELMDEHTTLEQAYLDLTADATEFASAGRREV